MIKVKKLRPTLHIRGGLLNQCKKTTPNQDTPHRLRTFVFDETFNSTITHNQTLSQKNAALAVPCMWLLEGPPMPKPTPIYKYHSDANEARCRHRRQNHLQLYSISTANIVSTDGKAWCPVVEKKATPPRHILGHGVGPKWGP